MGGCSVALCKNRFQRGKKHFFRFPNDWRKNLWMQFTLRENFTPIKSSWICEDHFTSDSYSKRKDRMVMNKDAIPTLMYKDFCIYSINFDPQTRTYSEEDFIQLKTPAMSQFESVESIIQRKQSRVDELKGCCRFCFTNDENKAPIERLKSYSIDVVKLMTQLDLDVQLNTNFSDFLCEQCFQQIVDIEAFKKKVREAQQDITSEVKEFDDKINEIIETQQIDIIAIDSMEILEENAPSDEVEVGVNTIAEEILDDDDAMEEVECIEEYEEIIEEECKDTIEEDSGTIDDYNTDLIEEVISENTEAVEYELEKYEMTEVSHGVDEYEMASPDDIIKNPGRNRFCFKIYECFFCKMKFAGHKTYVAHKCPVTEIQCEKCDKYFSKLQTYNSHLSHVHGSLPTRNNYCPICKIVIVSTVNQFKAHRRNCNKKANNQLIECEICQKVCNNLKGYTIHKLFHETRDYTTSTGQKIVSNGLNAYKEPSICELCGKEFQSSAGYRMHRRNVHKIGSEGQTFQCPSCPKIFSTRRSLFDHTRNSHRVQNVTCNVCGKIYRTKILLKKHMMYHDESRRAFFCEMCPERQGYFTKVALMRHLKTHMGKKDYSCSECDRAFTTNYQLKIHFSNKHAISEELTATEGLVTNEDLAKTQIEVLETTEEGQFTKLST